MSGQLVVDVGKSQLRAAGSQQGSPRSRVEREGGISPVASATDAGVVDLAEAIPGLAAAAFGSPAAAEGLDWVLIASTAVVDEEQASWLGSRLHEQLPLATILLCDDGIAVHAAALDGPGITLGLGTGAVAVSVTASGALTRSDGWGPVLGDRGSAFDLGRRGLVTAFRDEDWRRDSALRQAARDHLGELGVEAAKRLLADPGWVAFVADFARAVCELAAKGDPAASEIVDGAVDALFDTARSLGGSEDARMALVGRLAATELGRRLALRASGAGHRIQQPHSGVLDLDVERFSRSLYREHASFIAGRS